MKNITAIIISFLRSGYTKACIKSLKEQYPDIKIIVGENGEFDISIATLCQEVGAKYIQLPYDSGVCYARNALVKLVETEYILVGDDDFFYTGEAKIEQMKNFLEQYREFDLIGGRVEQDGVVRNYQGTFEKFDDHFETYGLKVEETEFKIGKLENGDQLLYYPVDLTFNFFVARTEIVKQVLWDEEIKVAYEHFSWFYDFKCAGYKVAFTPEAKVIHKPHDINPEEKPEYKDFRCRKQDKERFFEKYAIDYFIDINGSKTFAPNHINETRKNDLKFVDFCITTFKRPEALRRLLLSIAKYYPSANVYVADQSEKFDRDFYKTLRAELLDAGMQKRVSFERLPFDCGLSYARNHLVLTTPNKYKLILDDDMEFSEETDIKKFIQLMEMDKGIGIVGGSLKQLGQEVHFEFNFRREKDALYHENDGDRWKRYQGIKYKATGCVLNFALMKRELFNLINWDQNLKVTEHLDFYIRMQNVHYRILYTPEVVINHPPHERNEEYKAMRTRTEFLNMMMRKHGLKKIKYLNGQVTELDQEGIKRYREQPE